MLDCSNQLKRMQLTLIFYAQICSLILPKYSFKTFHAFSNICIEFDRGRIDKVDNFNIYALNKVMYCQLSLIARPL